MLVGLALRRTVLGLYVEAIGGNPNTARLSGLRVNAIRIIVYMACALCAAVAGLIAAGDIKEADVANAGLYLELDAIAAVVVGGTLLAGGVGSVIGTLIGVLMLGLILTSITTYEGMMSSGMTRVAIGLLLLAFVLMQKLLTRRLPGELHGA